MLGWKYFTLFSMECFYVWEDQRLNRFTASQFKSVSESSSNKFCLKIVFMFQLCVISLKPPLKKANECNRHTQCQRKIGVAIIFHSNQKLRWDSFHAKALSTSASWSTLTWNSWDSSLCAIAYFLLVALTQYWTLFELEA